jgi:glutamyl-Q tRNA(Asp) synthetase
MASDQEYRGRFAPTPSGPLHLGSLLTALASFLEARRAGGAWLLRIDDLDAPRCPPGAADTILRQLEAHVLHWDGAPRRQSAHRDEYRGALEALQRRGLLYRCGCTRAQLRTAARPGPDGPVYAGTCRALNLARGSLRLRPAPGRRCLDDAWQGRQCRDLEAEVGDVVVLRADGQPSYQLACAVDEHAQAITDVVRGVDLLGSTFQQGCIQAALGLRVPRYRHVPVLVDDHGRKLSKQNHAPAADPARATANLHRCLELLGQAPPPALASGTAARVLQWAVVHWDAARVPRAPHTGGTIPYNALQQSRSDRT